MADKAQKTDVHRDAAGRRVYPPGHKLHGEPMPEAPGPRLKAVRTRAPIDMPMTQAARQLLMGGADAVTRKFTPTMDARPGDVPEEGTPATTERPGQGGSVLPLVSASRTIPDAGTYWTTLIDTGKILAPPYDPWLLVCAVDESDILPVCIEAVATNIGGHGIEMVPLFETRDETTGQEIEAPTEAQAERDDLALFLEALCIEHGLQGLMELVDRDIEAVGWGTMEVRRDRTGQVAAMNHVPAYTIRLGPEHPPIAVEVPIRHPTKGDLITLTRWRRFRLYCQIKEGRTVWFKSFGDPRHVNWKTGQVRPAGAEPWGVDQQGNSLEATEIAYIRRYHPATPYGVPLWMGGIPHVKASRAAAELLVDWFDNAPIGIWLAMIAGGRWKEGAMDYLQAQINGAARGTDNAWNVVPLEGESAEYAEGNLNEDSRDTPPRIDFQALRSDPPTELYHGRDSLIDRSTIRVRSMWRLGAIYFGDSEGESNRAAADTARAIGEEQVFIPLRRSRWEHFFNVLVLPAMGINYWQIRLKGAVTGDDTEGLAQALSALVKGGGASPNTLAKLYSRLTGEAVALIAEPWGDRPLELTMALLAKGMDPNEDLASLAAQAAERAAEMRAALAKGGGPAGGGKGEDEDEDGDEGAGGTAAKVAKALAAADDFLTLREALISLVQAEAGDAVAEQLAELPGDWTSRA